MGEIEEALRRARESRPGGRPAANAASASKTAVDVYSVSAERHAREQPQEPEPRTFDADAPREPSPPAPPPNPAPPPDPATEAAAQSDRLSDGRESSPAVELTHHGAEARAPQGVLVDDGGAITDACLQLALRVRKAMNDRDARTLVVVSALRNEGKTTVSCNLALALAALGQVSRVALVDLDLRRPSLETVLELETGTVGIGDVLAGEASLAEARVPVAAPRLDVYPCLRGQPKAHELLLLDRFEAIVAELREAYDFVVFDSPPSLLVPDPTIIMQHVECFAPVARAGLTRARNFKKMMDLLPGKRMLGGILDGGSIAIRKSYYAPYQPDPTDETEELAAAEVAAHGG